MSRYLWQAKDWPNLTWDAGSLLGVLGRVRLAQGKMLALASLMARDEALRTYGDALEKEVLGSSAIEGEVLSRSSVRSSIARFLGLPSEEGGKPLACEEGAVEILLDATHHFDRALSSEILFGWHRCLFPTGQSGLYTIRTGAWRTEEMEVVSGPYGHRTVHFEAPPAGAVAREMNAFIRWFNASRGSVDGLVRAAVAHLYFVTVHPFDDGNGRITRTITEMAISQDEDRAQHLYSLSTALQNDRTGYYRALESAQKGTTDITAWILWFLQTMEKAIAAAMTGLHTVAEKTAFWDAHKEDSLTASQRKVLNRLLAAGRGGFEGGLSTRKYVSLAKVSRATAWREISDLVEKGMLRPLPGGGRSTAYEIHWADQQAQGKHP